MTCSVAIAEHQFHPESSEHEALSQQVGKGKGKAIRRSKRIELKGGGEVRG